LFDYSFYQKSINKIIIIILTDFDE